MTRILVADDERAVRVALRVNLEKAGYEVELASDGAEALGRIQANPPDLLLTDLKMPQLDGHALLASALELQPELPVVMMTGHGSVADAVRAMRAGATDYIIKPISKEELLVILRRALRERALEAEVVQLRAELAERSDFEKLIGRTPAMQRVYELVRAVADSNALVLLTGPTGTGKELLSNAIHEQSVRRPGPFVGVNCAALPEGLLESELFGHEKGAFTGAVRQHAGKFEQADGGTLLLDEIGEIPLSTQVRLLRVLESGELQRVGGRETIKVDVRVIAATNRNLRVEVREGRFREDLFYRLNVFHIPVPALAERRADIPLLAEHFVARYAQRHRRPAQRLGPDALQQLQDHSWPGNVRELEHAIERAVILTPGEQIDRLELGDSTDLRPAEASQPIEPASPHLTDALRSLEHRMIVAALQQEKGVQAKAARVLGISRSNLNYRIQKLGIVVRDVTYTTSTTDNAKA